MKKVLLAGLLISSMFYNVACDSDELAAGAIGVGVGIGLGSSNDGYHDGYRDGRRHRRDHYDRGDRWGRGGYRDCNYYRCYNAAEVADQGQNAQEVAAEFTASSFAQKHNIPNASAAKIQNAFNNVGKNGIAAFQAIGLNEQDVRTIMKREVPSAPAMRNVSAKLDISEAQSTDLLKSLVAEFDQQASNSGSNYWQSCQAKGQWKTPQNAFCKDASWNGCSPETGASLCY